MDSLLGAVFLFGVLAPIFGWIGNIGHKPKNLP